MVKYCLKNIFVIITFILTRESNVTGQENNIKIQQNYQNVSTVDKMNNKKTTDIQVSQCKVQEVFNEKHIHHIKLDITNPTFKELKLTITDNHDTPNHFHCDKYKTYTMERTEDNGSKIIPDSERDIINESKTRKFDAESNLGADSNESENVLNSLSEMIKSNANTGSDLRFIGKECTTDEENMYVKYNKNNHNAVSNDDYEIKYKQEASNDWPTFSKHMKYYKENDDPRFNVQKTARKETRRHLEQTNKQGINKEKSDKEVIPKADDLIKMLDRIKEIYVDKILKYVKHTYIRNILDFNLDAKAYDTLKELRIYQVRNGIMTMNIPDVCLRDIITNEFEDFKNNPVLPHNYDNDAIYIPRDLFKHLQIQVSKEGSNRQTKELKHCFDWEDWQSLH